MRIAACLFFVAWSAFAQPAGTEDTLRHALAAYRRRDFAEAVRGYRQVLAKRPDLSRYASISPRHWRKWASLIRWSPIAAAGAELEKLNAAPPGDVAVGSLADCYLRSGAAAKAIAVIEQLQKSEPNNPDLNYELGRALVRAGGPADGLEPLERAGRLGRSADAYLLAGATALDLAQFQRAIEDLEMDMDGHGARSGKR